MQNQKKSENFLIFLIHERILFLNKSLLRMCFLKFSRSCLESLIQMTIQVKGEGSVVIYSKLLAVLH